MIIEYKDGHVHRIRLDFSDLKEVPKLVAIKSIADSSANESILLDAALLSTLDVVDVNKTYSVLTYQSNRVWLNGYDK